MKLKSHFLTRPPKPSNDQIKNLKEEKKKITLKSIFLDREIKFLLAKIDELEEMQRDHEEILYKLSNLYILES